MSRADELYRATCLDILENGFSDENLEVRPHWADDSSTNFFICKSHGCKHMALFKRS